VDKTITIQPTATPYTLFYRDKGAGAPTLLLHGFAEDSTVWDNQIDVLGNACRLIIPDLPGSGRSSALHTPISIEGMATIIRDLLDQLKIDQCTLIGHSMGGYITLAFAALFPERLNAFGLFHSTAYPDSEEKKTTRRKAIDFIRANGSAPFIRQSIPNLFSAHTREHRPQLIETTIANYSDFAPESLIAYYEAMIARPDRTDVLRQFTRPVLFIVGRDDNVIPMQQMLEQCYLPSISHLHILKDTGHQAMLENPKMSNQLLRDFLNFVSRI
jgi:pimeloyl-ACP methyl ester carboxylesterase